MTDPLDSPTVDPEAVVPPGASVLPEPVVPPEPGASLRTPAAPPEAPVVRAPSPSAAVPDLRPRPLVERIGMAGIALVIGALFVIVAVAAFVGGEPFLGVMGAAGAVMVLWLGGLTLIRG